MIIKLTLFGLILVLIAVIAASYYVNKEGFEDVFSSVTTDLGSAVNTVQPTPINPPIISPDNSTIPQRTDIKPEVSLSSTGYDAMSLQQKADFLKDIQKVVRNEILANRLTTPLVNGKLRDSETTATIQGKEYENGCCKNSENGEGCPAIPDMSKYIRKDAIPCWGCNIDY